MASETFPPLPTPSRFPRLISHLPVPGLTVVAALGALTWVVALWLGPWLMPAPKPPAPEAADHEAALDPVANVLALSKPDNAPEVPPKALLKNISVRRGDTLIAVLARAKVPSDDAHAAVAALRKVFDPRDLLPGLELTLTFQPPTTDKAGAASFRKLEFMPSIEKTVGVNRTWDNRFESYATKAKLTHEQTRGSGSIENSLYADAVGAGVPAPVIVELIRAMSYDVDFQRDIQPHDRFDVLYDRIKDADGNVVGSGKMLYAALTLSGKKLAIYRFRQDDGTYDYFNSKGESTRKALMRTPIDGARLSSTFGRRHHPILGFTTMHKGVDFAAPRGTPIMAAGRGVVVDIRWWGGYGRYIRVRHNTTYATAYAHMSGFAKGLHRGSRVSQGQVIGYVGTTGRSTGPHLHYEVLKNGIQVNPLSVKLPTGRTLHGHERERFLTVRDQIDQAMAQLPPVADNVPDKTTKAKVHHKTGSGQKVPLGIGGGP